VWQRCEGAAVMAASSFLRVQSQLYHQSYHLITNTPSVDHRPCPPTQQRLQPPPRSRLRRVAPSWGLDAQQPSAHGQQHTPTPCGSPLMQLQLHEWRRPPLAV
jgi:hypothetical protein